MREVLLDAVASKSPTRLIAELEDRGIPLVFIVDPEHRPMMMSWPHVPGPVLPVFADLASLYKAASEVGRGENFGFGALKFGALLQWARAESFTVAIGVFDEHGAPYYLPLG